MGKYQLQGDRPILITIGVQDGILTAALNDRNPSVLTTESDVQFSKSELGLTITFVMDESGDHVERASFSLLGREPVPALPIQ